MNRILMTALAATAAVAVSALPAAAKCTRLGFSVNDYGKDGPTQDAKKLLDTHIAKWAAEHNIAKYTVGKKEVKCDLFLDLIVFDEHTCRAEANVCWTEAPGQKPFNTPAPGEAAASPAAPKTPKPAVKAVAKPAPTETGTLPPAAKPAAKPAAPAQKSEGGSASDKAAAAADLAAAAAERAAAAAAAAERAAAAAAKASAAQPPVPAPAAQPSVAPPQTKAAPPAQ